MKLSAKLGACFDQIGRWMLPLLWRPNFQILCWPSSLFLLFRSFTSNVDISKNCNRKILQCTCSSFYKNKPFKLKDCYWKKQLSLGKNVFGRGVTITLFIQQMLYFNVMTTIKMCVELWRSIPVSEMIDIRYSWFKFTGIQNCDLSTVSDDGWWWWWC